MAKPETDILDSRACFSHDALLHHPQGDVWGPALSTSSGGYLGSKGKIETAGRGKELADPGAKGKLSFS